MGFGDMNWAWFVVFHVYNSGKVWYSCSTRKPEMQEWLYASISLRRVYLAQARTRKGCVVLLGHLAQTECFMVVNELHDFITEYQEFSC